MATSSTSTPRRPYHHGNLREALLDAAVEQTREGGAAALSLREATRQVGVSPNAAYRHFADRDALLHAVAEVVQDRMADRMERRQEQAEKQASTHRPRDRALRRLRAVGLGYVDFAWWEPGWFELAFFGAGPEDAEELTVGSRVAPPYVLLSEAIDDLIEVGVLDPDRRDGALWACWSAVHGFAELLIHGPMHAMSDADVRAYAFETVDAIVAGVVRRRT